jgi:hypothetical protein
MMIKMKMKHEKTSKKFFVSQKSQSDFLGHKKSQGLSFNVIIIAALSLIVLVVVLVIFSERSSIFGKSLESCSGKAGECKESCGTGEATIPNAKCPEKESEAEKDTCCVKIFKRGQD